jgi:uncharacterized protein YueI
MTEYNIFCWAKEYDDENSFQQKRYRIFNTEISKEEYQKIFVPKIKLEFDKDLSYDVRCKKARKDVWNKLSIKEKEAYTNLPHFNPEIFEEITGIKIEKIEVKQETTLDKIEKINEYFKKVIDIIKE